MVNLLGFSSVLSSGTQQRNELQCVCVSPPGLIAAHSALIWLLSFIALTGVGGVAEGEINMIQGQSPPFELLTSPMHHYHSPFSLLLKPLSYVQLRDHSSTPPQEHESVWLHGLCCGAGAFRGPPGRRGAAARRLPLPAPQLHFGLLRDGNQTR